ncbi:MAG: hypothetical protein F4047_12015 [Caldilineaceae bacterium SB0670_bin_27]|uniref:Formyl transferase N-terminal domain-containing protein n=1 Tax=Caldilineaceae bacterium SB0664_bin_27 TaxID=2605260 RepID=A0A6B0YS73_9CHLR|nr:hypothetical protein [Caldilineaceae bacterium SB0664_bin_27]MYJ78838.1 hypothetical protein [Caldilineaceae bacterium SB0670_bin_27]
MSKTLRTLFAGMSGPFSRIVLDRLLANNIGIAAVLLSGQSGVPLRKLPRPRTTGLSKPGDGFEIPLENTTVTSAATVREEYGVARGSSTPAPARAADWMPPAIPELADQVGAPSYDCGEIGHPEVTNWLAAMSVDVVCVACWNRVIPPSVLDIPRHGFLNVHPSLLPAYRGPNPLFWQYRAGEKATGVSVHWMDAGLDTGDIVGQRELKFEEGIRGAEAEELCALAGGELLAELLEKLKNGALPRTPQPAGGSYFPFPSEEDLVLDPNWDPRRAFNFMRAYAEWGIPFRLETEGTVFRLADALEWTEEASPEAAGEGTVWAQFRGGSVLAFECP